VQPHGPWKTVIFTDEMSLDLGAEIGSRSAIRQVVEEYELRYLQNIFASNRQTLMLQELSLMGRNARHAPPTWASQPHQQQQKASPHVPVVVTPMTTQPACMSQTSIPNNA
jgi:hypothetical protein